MPLIDLYATSDIFYGSAGPDAPGILADGTHSTAYGGYEFARCIATGIRQDKLGLARYLVSGFEDFDPRHPDSAAALDLAPLFDSGTVPPSVHPPGSEAPRGNPRRKLPSEAGDPGPGPL